MGKRVTIGKQKGTERMFRFTWEPASYDDVKWSPEHGVYSVDIPVSMIDGSREITDDSSFEDVVAYLARKLDEQDLGQFLMDEWDVAFFVENLTVEEL